MRIWAYTNFPLPLREILVQRKIRGSNNNYAAERRRSRGQEKKKNKLIINEL